MSRSRNEGAVRDDYDAVEVARALHRDSVREKIKEYAPDPEIDALAGAILDNIFDKQIDPDHVQEAIRLVVRGYTDDAKRFVTAFNKAQFNRLMLLQNRMDLLEDDLFDPNNLREMSEREKVRLYGSGTIRQKTIIEQIYKVMELELGFDEADDVMKKAGLEALTPVQRHKVVAFLDFVMQKMSYDPDIVDAEFTETKPKEKAAPKKKPRTAAPKFKVLLHPLGGGDPEVVATFDTLEEAEKYRDEDAHPDYHHTIVDFTPKKARRRKKADDAG